MWIRRPPTPALAPFAESLWTWDGTPAVDGAPGRELSLPSGRPHLVIRLSSTPIRIFAHVRDTEGQRHDAVVNGLRTGPHLRDPAGSAHSVGVLLRPGSERALFGVPASSLAGHHTALHDLWGAEAGALREQLAAADCGSGRLARLEAFLLKQVDARGPATQNTVVGHALLRFCAGIDDVGRVQRETGMSHRHFVELFRREVGVTPKVFCRLQRFQRVLAHAGGGLRKDGWAAIADACGYFDQSHLSRDFNAFTGLTPGAWYRRLGGASHHVSLPAAQTSDSSKIPGSRARYTRETSSSQERPHDQDP